jgi:hypothetical protein
MKKKNAGETSSVAAPIAGDIISLCFFTGDGIAAMNNNAGE